MIKTLNSRNKFFIYFVLDMPFSTILGVELELFKVDDKRKSYGKLFLLNDILITLIGI